MSIARLLGAPIAIRTGIPALRALCTSSNDNLPENSINDSTNAFLEDKSTFPTSLSIALCLPISSAEKSSSPDKLNKPQAWAPPDFSNND